LFGVGLILLLPLIADGLGRNATICAALLIAISPAIVFYSRYYIHEMLLVFFNLLALGAGWRYVRSRKPGWILLAGAAIGLMQATKETFILALFAALVGLAQNKIWTPKRSNSPTANQGLPVRDQALALAMWLLIALLFFSS